MNIRRHPERTVEWRDQYGKGRPEESRGKKIQLKTSRELGEPVETRTDETIRKRRDQ